MPLGAAGKQRAHRQRKFIEARRLLRHPRLPGPQVVRRAGWRRRTRPAGQQHQQLDGCPRPAPGAHRCRQPDAGDPLRHAGEAVGGNPPVVGEALPRPASSSRGSGAAGPRPPLPGRPPSYGHVVGLTYLISAPSRPATAHSKCVALLTLAAPCRSVLSRSTPRIGAAPQGCSQAAAPSLPPPLPPLDVARS